ncbi:uncharacterized protein LOC120682167 isoform X4 [Panicum virgatum]|uniref:RING-CH-type domain-containing protein n=1 Tax=Panicum virgatum TaxID=38727 RepID=A0A8T0PVW9_PANVG|nr:uncharacterized protein LOC120682167 isoform X4 [Panicum virgatum]KAG2564619.1 hypothetical protein PVAP13_7NG088636 [Panicum virgatum]
MEKEINNPPPHTAEPQDTTTTSSPTAKNPASSSDDQRPLRPHLSIDIPASSLPGDPLPTPTEAADITLTPTGSSSTTTRRSGIPITPVSSSGNSRSGKPLRSPSFMLRQTVRSLLPVGSFKSSVKGYEASFSKLFNSKVMARTSSLPLDDHQAVVDKSSTSSCTATQEPVLHMCRSQSLPMNMRKFNAKSFKRMDSLGGMYRVVPSTPRAPAASNVVPDIVPSSESAAWFDRSGVAGEDDGVDIPEEEAVCRICMVELSEGSDTLKLECSCKGELALAHKDCAMKWFTIKGTRTCEVCKQDVQNLPVTLLRVQSLQREPNRVANGGNRSRYQRVWHGTPILVIISILAYFCFLEQLLVAHDGIAALAISLPFSCILGLFSSLTTTSMVARRYVWIYAAVQFLFVVFFTHLFYRYLHLQAVISIILATFAGFGVGMTGNSIIVEILRWRVRRMAPPAPAMPRRDRRARAAQQQAPASDQPSGQSSVAGGGQHDTVAASDVENPALPQA